MQRKQPGSPVASSLQHQMKVAESRRTRRPQLCPRTPQAVAGKEPPREVAAAAPQPPASQSCQPPRSGPLRVPGQHLLAEQLAAHAAPEPGTGVGGPLAPRLLQRIQAAALQGLAHGFQAAVGLRQNVRHAGGRPGDAGAAGTRGAELGPAAGKGSVERSAPGGRAVTGARPGSSWCEAPLSPPFGPSSRGPPRRSPTPPAVLSCLLVPAPQTAQAARGGPRLPRRK